LDKNGSDISFVMADIPEEWALVGLGVYNELVSMDYKSKFVRATQGFLMSNQVS